MGSVKVKHIINTSIITVTIILVLAILAYMYPWIAIGLHRVPDPLIPQITYGEFPIIIKYEINGEIKTIEDIVICEYEGIVSLGTAGKYRKWSSRLLSGKTCIILLRVDDPELSYEVSFSCGFPDYYMGDYSQKKKNDYEDFMYNRNSLGFNQWDNGILTYSESIAEEVIWEKYKLRIIDIQYSLPIDNKFE